MQRITTTVGDRPREYLLHIPGLTAGARRPPLVIFLHGAGGTAAWADGETGWSALADRERFVLVLPEGLPPDPDRPPKFLTNPPRWNDVGGLQVGDLRSEIDESRGIANPSSSIHQSSIPNPQSDDVAFLAAVIGDAITRAGADPRRVYLGGFSNGAGMAFRAAAELADRIAAVAPVAGYCRVPDPRPARPVPTLYLVGTADPLVPLRGGEVRSPWQHRLVRRRPVADTLDRWAAALGCGPVPVAESDDDGVRVEVYPGPVEFRVVLIDGLGHHWPGGKGQLNHRIAGPPSDELDATAAVWEFFRRHQLS